MWTEADKKRIRAQLEAVQKCNGDCAHCEHLDIPTASTERALYFAIGCRKAPDFSPISESPRKLRAELIEALEFELA